MGYFIHSCTAQKGHDHVRLPPPRVLALITPVCCGRCQYPESHQIFSEVIVKYFVPCHHESLIMATGLFFSWHWTRYLETIGHPLGPGPGAGEGCQESEAELESLSLEQLNILTLRRCTALLRGWCLDNSLHSGSGGEFRQPVIKGRALHYITCESCFYTWHVSISRHSGSMTSSHCVEIYNSPMQQLTRVNYCKSWRENEVICYFTLAQKIFSSRTPKSVKK